MGRGGGFPNNSQVLVEYGDGNDVDENDVDGNDVDCQGEMFQSFTS